MSNILRDVLLEADKKEKKDSKTNGKKKEGKMLKRLHDLDDVIEDFIDSLQTEIINVEDNPVFVKKAHQLLADMSKEYSEFILALRSIVNAVDRKEKILPAFEKGESRVRDVLDGQGNGPPEEELPPEEEELPPEEDDKGGDDEFELKVSKKDKKKKKKSPVKEALEMEEAINPKTDLFLLGKEVNYALGNVGLRPKIEDFKKVAEKLGITIKQAQKAWNVYTWD